MVDGSSISCQLAHHGAAATSSSKTVICIPNDDSESGYSSEIVYASHAILNVAQPVTTQVDTKQEPVWRVHQTLRTNSQGSTTANTTVSTYTAKRVISCLSLLQNTSLSEGATTTLLCGFTDGTITTWKRNSPHGDPWIESILVKADDKEELWDGRSITDIGGVSENDNSLCVVTCSSGGAFQYRLSSSPTETPTHLTRTQLLPTPANTVRFHNLASNETTATLLLIGTAAPRHNKIHVFVLYHDDELAIRSSTHYCGALAGHEDWITCFDWKSIGNVDHLATGSQDDRIRLWKFTTTNEVVAPLAIPMQTTADLEEDAARDKDNDDDDDDVDVDEDDKEIEEGESRLEIVVPGKSQTSVTLEALLIGHEERVTSVSWHPNPKPVYGEDLILISSSMDRSIFIWAEVSGIWAPISRVGSAGGILGGSIGSSLLGFLNIQLEPNEGKWMMGLGYGGALHFFSCESNTSEITEEMTTEDRAALSPWKAQPCLTGHFEAVTDLCWESNAGEYLLTVGNDQTCRAWACLPVVDSKPTDEVWVEIARPQVHGYDLSAITSLSTPDHRHLLVSGADEKELRVFDATRTFEKLLRRVTNRVEYEDDSSNPRVDLAYIPSLGLSNKATASEGAEQDTGGVSESSTQLPLERDLGAVSLWPEVAKLYGHNTELTRLTSTTTAKTGIRSDNDMHQKDVLVASSAKARDVEAACIRIWNVIDNRCAQVLQGGHRSTVTALAFSPNSRFLVSSGKDRRLCVWERKKFNDTTWGPFELASAVDTAHKRIVWGAHFCPFDSNVFSTCSRDGTIKLWTLSQTESGTVLEETLMFSPACLASNGKPEAVTSISFAPIPIHEDRTLALLALGLENGMIELWQVPLNQSNENLRLECSLPSEQCHIASVTKLAWRPLGTSGAANGAMVLASSSLDHGCRIFKIIQL